MATMFGANPMSPEPPWWEALMNRPRLAAGSPQFGAGGPTAAPQQGNPITAGALGALQNFGGQIFNPPSQAIALAPQVFALPAAVGWASRTFGGKPEAAPAADPAQLMAGWDFSAPAGAPGTVPGQKAVPAQTPWNQPEMLIDSLLGGAAQYTSGKRTPEKQQQLIAAWEAGGKKGVKPADNSFHLTDQARDFIPPKGMSMQQAADLLKATGKFAEVINEKNHVHVAWAKKPDVFTMPGLPGVPDMSSMIPDPTRPTHLDMPDAPQMAQGPARPEAEQMDVQGTLEMLREFAPPEYDKEKAQKGRLKDVLAGIGAGAARADVRQGVGAMLAAIGAGASGAATAWDKEARQDEKASAEATRLFDLGLAKMGIDMESTNRGTRNANSDRKWQDARDKLTTDFTNAQSAWDVATKEAITNLGLDNQYLRDVDQAKYARAQSAMRSIEQNVDITSRQILGQQDLDLKRFLFQEERSAKAATDDQVKVMSGMLAGIGVDPKVAAANKDVVGLNAAQGALYIAANNKPAAINALGREMAFTGQYKNLPDKKLVGQIDLLAKTDPELAAATLGRLLNEGEAADPGSALAWAKTSAAQGYPVGQLFLRHLKQPAPAVQGGTNGRAR